MVDTQYPRLPKIVKSSPVAGLHGVGSNQQILNILQQTDTWVGFPLLTQILLGSSIKDDGGVFELLEELCPGPSSGSSHSTTKRGQLFVVSGRLKKPSVRSRMLQHTCSWVRILTEQGVQVRNSGMVILNSLIHLLEVLHWPKSVELDFHKSQGAIPG